ncbi:PBP1b-binding outer membrane lipoprotein LpoB [Actinoplanes tereljensis]|uniref:Uncharacterized protein n=1 Tax=Paractinoplanes tereljensis TaxID=571912 RepID=A0A919TR54_9ACTN|nr:hypothetical protein [Actinoplanes tereljensis]GIF19863.1 hypothetical protein Ate02nite_25930 [Actinoplanes tereljensis]
MNGKLVLVTALTILVAGCSAPAVHPESAPSPAASLPSASPSETKETKSAKPTKSAEPTAIPIDPGPSDPPAGASDVIKKTDWVVGTVVRDSSGPCYTLETDEGTQYALHSVAGTKLVKGVRMRIKTAPTKLRIDCGPGRLMEMVAAEPLR